MLLCNHEAPSYLNPAKYNEEEEEEEEECLIYHTHSQQANKHAITLT